MTVESALPILSVLLPLVMLGSLARRLGAIANRRRRGERAVFAVLVFAATTAVLQRPILASVVTDLTVAAIVAAPGLIAAGRALLRGRPRAGAPIGSRSAARAAAGVAARLALLAAALWWEPPAGALGAWIGAAPGLPAAVALAAAIAPHLGWLAAVAVGYVVARRLARSEPAAVDRHFALAVVVLLWAVVLVVGGRPATAAVAVAETVALLAALSAEKHRYTHMNLHAYDLVAFLRDRTALRFLIDAQRPLVVRMLGRLGLAFGLVGAVALVEPVAIGPTSAAWLVAVAAGLVVTARRRLPARDFLVHFSRPVHVARLFETVTDAGRAWWRGGVLEIAASPSLPPLPPFPPPSAPAPIARAETPPDIVLILNESTFPPWLYVDGACDPEVAAFFRSADGRTRGLRVETFGGMSWKTEFSVMTGIPAGAYEAFGTHVFHWATGHIRHSLPGVLATHGYRGAVLYPSAGDFAGADGFYASIGIDTMLDRAALGLGSDWAPDRVYLDRGLAWLRRHAETGGGPAFLFVLTMANHAPHDRRYRGDDAPPTEPIADRELDEYLRRLRATARDYAAFRDALAAALPSRRFVIVHFGDHQPPFTASLLGHHTPWGSVPEQFPREHLAYRTYVAIDGVNRVPTIAPDLPDEIEIAYLGTVVLEAAGLPLDPIHALRRDLMRRHGGALWFADGGRLAAAINRRMLERGLLVRH